MYKVKRVPTGIKNFDEQIGGGFPEGFTILLAGAPGTGKSIFGLAYIYNGAKKFGENGLYISFEQDAESLKKQASMFEWDFENLCEKASIRFLPLNAPADVLLSKISEYLLRTNAKRLVIDSFTTLFSVTEEFGRAVNSEGRPILKKDVLEFFNRIKKLNCTTLLISEIRMGTEKLSEEGMSEFACDGIILLKRTTMGSEEVRTISVEKMRQTKTKSGNLNLAIEDEGIIIEKE